MSNGGTKPQFENRELCWISMIRKSMIEEKNLFSIRFDVWWNKIYSIFAVDKRWKILEAIKKYCEWKNETCIEEYFEIQLIRIALNNPSFQSYFSYENFVSLQRTILHRVYVTSFINYINDDIIGVIWRIVVVHRYKSIMSFRFGIIWSEELCTQIPVLFLHRNRSSSRERELRIIIAPISKATRKKTLVTGPVPLWNRWLSEIYFSSN